MIYDVIIVGGGPAGLTASIYAKRANKTCAVIEKEITGGMINNSAYVENIPGFPAISGPGFSDLLTSQAEKAGVEIIYDEVTNVETTLHVANHHIFTITTNNEKYTAHSVIIATGTKHNVLGLEHEEDLIGNGVHFCALCDGAFYKGKDVVVIGGGNSALTEALYLSNICKSVTILQNLPQLTGDSILISRVSDADNIEVITNCNISSYSIDDNKLIGINYTTEDIGTIYSFRVSTAYSFKACDGVFLCIGLSPMPDITDNLLEYSKSGYIIKSRTNGLFFAGDCSYDTKVKQVAVACASGAVAATEACNYIDRIN